MTTYTAAQIANVGYRAGWRGEDLVTAVAVALAESSGDVTVVNSIGCVGLWQINVPVHVKEHPSWTTAAMQNADANAGAAYALWRDAHGWRPWEAYTNGMYAAQMGRARLAVAQVGKTDATAPATPADNITGGAVVNADLAGTLLGTIGGIPGSDALIGGVEKFLGQMFGGTSDGSTSGDVAKAIGAPIALLKALASLVVLAIHGAAWIANPRNWLRVVEVVGGGVAIIVGLKMLAASNTGGVVASAARGTVRVADKGVKAVKSTAKAAGEAGAAVATGGASAAAEGATATAGMAAKAATAAKGAAK
ncbi:hypothetical protein ACFV4G_39700 [Kitasatospora sp. NPDC059747]|uniref:hypothetical protein n=1 Tax=Kitasatospora sp. NPDC059747 TaxID=3346930 RepID=UPI0036632588